MCFNQRKKWTNIIILGIERCQSLAVTYTWTISVMKYFIIGYLLKKIILLFLLQVTLKLDERELEHTMQDKVLVSTILKEGLPK
jgi:hypothetical protein